MLGTQGQPVPGPLRLYRHMLLCTSNSVSIYREQTAPFCEHCEDWQAQKSQYQVTAGSVPAPGFSLQQKGSSDCHVTLHP